ncbi:MAG: hypothetical protein JW914_00650, partial [Syntrophaceae bacterium]|nr:hypothetical protein [Syntrophaceae bacterium]
MPQYSEKIIELLRADYPDLSAWKIICANDRSVDPVQYFIHSRMGGILPKVESFDSYISEKIGDELKLHPVASDEQLLLFIQFISEKYPDEPYPARRASHLLPLLEKLAEYNITCKTVFGAERFTEEEWSRLEEYLNTAQDFRKWLSKNNLFVPKLELYFLGKIKPEEKEIFIGLPEITPLTESFYRKISKERMFIAPPLFGEELAPAEKLPFDSAKDLVTSFGAEVKPADGENIELVSLEGLHSLVDMVTLEVSDFLKERS